MSHGVYTILLTVTYLMSVSHEMYRFSSYRSAITPHRLYTCVAHHVALIKSDIWTSLFVRVNTKKSGYGNSLVDSILSPIKLHILKRVQLYITLKVPNLPSLSFAKSTFHGQKSVCIPSK